MAEQAGEAYFKDFPNAEAVGNHLNQLYRTHLRIQAIEIHLATALEENKEINPDNTEEIGNSNAYIMDLTFELNTTKEEYEQQSTTLNHYAMIANGGNLPN